MALLFTAASSQRLGSSGLLVSALPIVAGVWFRLTAVGASVRTIWNIGASTGNPRLAIRMTTTELIGAESINGAGISRLASTATAISAGVWNFAIARFISDTNRRISLLHGSGLIEHGVNTVNNVISGLDHESFGARVNSSTASEFWDGEIAEYFLCNADLYDGAADLPDTLMRQLAFGGPFSVANVGSSLVEYRSFRTAVGDGGGGQDIYRREGNRIWTNENGITFAPHPPFPYWRERPRQIIRPRIF